MGPTVGTNSQAAVAGSALKTKERATALKKWYTPRITEQRDDDIVHLHEQEGGDRYAR